MRASLATTFWFAASLPEARRFRRATAQVAEAQTRLLKHYLDVNRDTDYGRRSRFASITSIEDYQQHAPLATYDDYTDLIDCVANGQPNVLTAEPVRMLEQSSGSTAASKLIPYTATLKSEFQRGLAPWIVDLYSHHPDLKHGPAYWSITPLTEGRRLTPGGIRIGFEEDSAYLGPLGPLVESALAVPNLVKHIRDVTTFRYVTLLFLLRQRDLRLISVWNPTFLSLLLAPLPNWRDQLLADIANGTITPPAPLDPDVWRRLQRRLTPDPHRARELGDSNGFESPSGLWPRLGLISCWADGPSATYARALQQQFPNVLLQPKGLLATEAFVSFPLTSSAGSVLAITSHFFEFLPAPAGSPDPAAQPRLAHRLEKGKTYAVVVTTGGGFYRYQLHDVVEVVGFVNQAPCIRFVGKTDRVSDWFGEKLNEQFVAGVLSQLFSRRQLSPAFAMLAPDESASGFRYTLYLELSSGQHLNGLPHDLDAALRENFHYDYCRKLGQLAEPRIALVANGADAYLRACQSRGQKLGNIKPAALQKTTGWDEWLRERR